MPVEGVAVMLDGTISAPAAKPSRGIPIEAVIRNRPNWLLRLLGVKFKEDRSWHFKWGSWSRAWGLSIELFNFDEEGDWSLKLLIIYGSFFITIPFLPTRNPKDPMLDSWGFSWRWDPDNRGADIHLNWGEDTKIIHLPWDHVFVRGDMLCDDGIWRKRIGSWELKEGDPVRATETHPYRYVCQGGTVQDDIEAKISVEEREWRQRWLRWTKFGALVKRTIEVEFNHEVGEERGSWKGGCTGCEYEMRPDETPVECLRRMQRDRRF